MAVRSLLHWGPLIALGIILTLATSTVYIVFWALPPPSAWMLAYVGVWAALVVIILLAFFRAMYTGPGTVPLGWAPANKEHESSLQFCKVCKGFKAPRAHHCHQCGACMKKMDHHCPWINSCVGNDNHIYFLTFVATVPIGCLQTFLVMLNFILYHWPEPVFIRAQRRFAMPPEQMWQTVIALFSCGLSIGVAIAVGFLCFIQLRGIFKNRTDIEAWIVEKAAARAPDTPFVFPYDRGLRNNIFDVWDHARRRDGIHWAVREGCDEYTLTREQLLQKERKRSMAELCVVRRRPGWCLDLFGSGWRTAYDSPLLSATRLFPKPGEHIFVTSGSKLWSYGELGHLSESGDFVAAVPRQRGWVPNACLRLVRHSE